MLYAPLSDPATAEVVCLYVAVTRAHRLAAISLPEEETRRWHAY